MQNQIQEVVPKVITDPLCTSIGICQTVADLEGLVILMQRQRKTFSKIAHLQDEVCDTIQVVHPHNLRNLKVFITDLFRRFMIPSLDGDDGYVIDDIDGWRV